MINNGLSRRDNRDKLKKNLIERGKLVRQKCRNKLEVIEF